jgi:hypothetical protein
MTMKKSELRSMIREMIQEELTRAESSDSLTEAVKAAPDECILAFHVMMNPDTNKALESRDAVKLLSIVDQEMEKNNLYTKGANTFRSTIEKMTCGMETVPYAMQRRLAQYIGDSYLKAAGMGMSKSA